MDRGVRNLLHLKGSTRSLTTAVPSVRGMADGEERYVLTGGVLYLYVKQKGILWKFTGAKVS